MVQDCFVVEKTSANAVNQYTLSEGFNISTASFDGGANAKQFSDSGSMLTHKV